MLRRLIDTLEGDSICEYNDILKCFPLISEDDVFLEHFSLDNPSLLSRELFKRSVKRVVIEVSSFCNRTCNFCPNTSGIRLKESYMDRTMYRNLLNDLKEISFTNPILFHLYNEPLANPYLEDYVKTAKLILPNSNLGFNSNGDFLDIDRLDKLDGLGLNFINFSLYGPHHGDFDREYLLEKISKILGLIGSSSEINIMNDEIQCSAKYKNINIRIYAKNFNLQTLRHDRGGSVLSQNEYERKMPCFSPFYDCLVSWSGKVIPCCNIHPDLDEHQQYIIGDLSDTSIFKIYSSEEMVEWRKNTFRFKPKVLCCKGCNREDRVDYLETDFFDKNKKNFLTV